MINLAMSTASDNGPRFEPQPIHRAIDQATILMLLIRRLRAMQDAGTTVDAELVTQFERVVDQLTGLLIECRDS